MENVLEKNKTSHNGTILSMGFWSSLIITLLGASYFVVIVLMLITGNFKLPPSEFIQIYAAIVDLLLCPLMIVLIAAIHYIVPNEKKILSQLGLIFSSIFTVMVTINRFIQITVVRLSINEGDLEGLKRFYPYDTRSVMFALELFGFGFFLSIALIFVAAAFSSYGIQKLVRYIFAIYSILGFISIIGFIFNSLITNVGFIAWGLVLYIGTGLLSAFFYKAKRSCNI